MTYSIPLTIPLATSLLHNSDEISALCLTVVLSICPYIWVVSIHLITLSIEHLPPTPPSLGSLAISLLHNSDEISALCFAVVFSICPRLWVVSIHLVTLSIEHLPSRSTSS